jgi:hypothetical protein
MHVCLHLQIHTHSYEHGCMQKCIYVRIQQGICRVGACARTCMCASKCKICVCVLVCVRARLCAKSLCMCVCACLRASACVYECAREHVRARARTHAHLCVCIRPSRSAAAPEVALRVHVGAAREQRRHHRRVPVASGFMERRLPAAERARAHTAARAVGACKWVRVGVRVPACACGRVCVSVRAQECVACVCVCVRACAYTSVSIWLRASVCVCLCACPSAHACVERYSLGFAKRACVRAVFAYFVRVLTCACMYIHVYR